MVGVVVVDAVVLAVVLTPVFFVVVGAVFLLF